MLGQALLLQLALTAVEVSGTSACPTPAQVEQKLQDLAPGLSSSKGTLYAELSPQDAGVRMVLKGVDGAQVAERVVTGSRDCDALARAASVVLLSWASEFQSAGLRAEPPQQAMPRSDLPEAPATEPPPLKPQVEFTSDLDVAAGLTAAVARGGLAMGGLLSGALTSRSAHVGGQVSLQALGAHAETGANVTWERFALGAGPSYRLQFKALHVDLHAQALAALLSVIPEDGAGGARTSFDPGAAVGVRVVSNGGIWGGAQGVYWFMERALPDGGPLPRAELLLTLGLSWSYP